MIDTRKTSAISHAMAGVGEAFSTLVRQIKLASERRATRAALGRLDAHLMRDIGLSETQVRRETLKHFWIE